MDKKFPDSNVPGQNVSGSKYIDGMVSADNKYDTYVSGEKKSLMA